MAGLMKTAGVICGCVLGLTLGVEMGDPAGSGHGAGLRLHAGEAHAASRKLRKILEQEKKEAEGKKAARKKQEDARRERLKGTRAKELPADCALARKQHPRQLPQQPSPPRETHRGSKKNPTLPPWTDLAVSGRSPT